MSQLGWLLLMLLCVRLSITCLPSNVPPLQQDFYPRLTVLQSGRPFLGLLSSFSATRMDDHQNHVENRKGSVSVAPLRAGLG